MPTALRLRTIVSAPFEENSYVVGRESGNEVVVIDPGFEPDLILEFVRDEGLNVVGILNTHGHADHIAGNTMLKEAFPEAPLIIGHGDAPMLTNPELNLSASFGLEVVSPPADRLVTEGETVDIAGLELSVLEIPGHSPGHVVFVYRGLQTVVFGGDVLFRGSIGRTDFPGGSFETLARGIRQKLWILPAETVVYPGHGPATTIGHERLMNPFVAGDS
ncbi:MAG: MBL fold metallo-hydrolase [Gemmataceae bacterium]|nr:MBL fold metallo-hydrolase [Gemmataceae bacterium]